MGLIPPVPEKHDAIRIMGKDDRRRKMIDNIGREYQMDLIADGESL